MRTRLLRQTRRHSRLSRGQALVEFTTFFVFIVFMLAGVIDTAGLLDDHINIVFAARQGARTAAVMGKNSAADCAVIGAVNAAMATMPNVQITKIHIYQADQSGKPAVSGGNTVEEVYPGGTTCVVNNGVPTITYPAGYTGAQPTVNNYPYSNRNNTPFTEDSVGLQLEYTYSFRLSFFSPFDQSTFSASDAAVMPISPVSVPTPGAGSGTPTATPCPTPSPGLPALC